MVIVPSHRSGLASAWADLASGSRVRLSDRKENDWAELDQGGGVKVQALTVDPRMAAVKGHSD